MGEGRESVRFSRELPRIPLALCLLGAAWLACATSRPAETSDSVGATFDQRLGESGQLQWELPRDSRVEVGKPLRHQVTELPEVAGETIEHQMHSQACPHCQWTTPCPWPAGVPAGNFGPRLIAVAGLVSGCYRSSTRTVAEILRDLFGVSISLGSVVACEQAVSRAVAPAVEEARSYVQRQAVANVDETNPFTMFLLPGHVQRQNLGCSA